MQVAVWFLGELAMRNHLEKACRHDVKEVNYHASRQELGRV